MEEEGTEKDGLKQIRGDENDGQIGERGQGSNRWWRSLSPCAANYNLNKPILFDMGSNMKTTIDISDSLMQEAKDMAARQSITLRALVEQGLREIMSKQKSGKKFTLRKASFKGKGLQDEFRGETWQKIREAAYEGHGG